MHLLILFLCQWGAVHPLRGQNKGFDFSEMAISSDFYLDVLLSPILICIPYFSSWIIFKYKYLNWTDSFHSKNHPEGHWAKTPLSRGGDKALTLALEPAVQLGTKVFFVLTTSVTKIFCVTTAESFIGWLSKTVMKTLLAPCPILGREGQCEIHKQEAEHSKKTLQKL